MNKELKEISKIWLRKLSPFIIVSLLSIIPMTYGALEANNSQGFSTLLIIYLLPIVLILLFIDVILKIVIKLKTPIIWIIECILILCILAYSLLYLL